MARSIAESVEVADPGLPAPADNVGEMVANSVTHGVGVAFGIVALTLLIVYGVLDGDQWSLGAGIAFGISLVLLYTGSTLYHAIPFPRARHVFKIIDHSAIYLLIAGTYTPFCLVTLREVTAGPFQHVCSQWCGRSRLRVSPPRRSGSTGPSGSRWSSISAWAGSSYSCSGP
jgi:hypothetical protein